MDNLKPCHCGGEVMHLIRGEEESIIECQKCGEVTDIEQLWNTRTGLPNKHSDAIHIVDNVMKSGLIPQIITTKTSDIGGAIPDPRYWIIADKLPDDEPPETSDACPKCGNALPSFDCTCFFVFPTERLVK